MKPRRRKRDSPKQVARVDDLKRLRRWAATAWLWHAAASETASYVAETARVTSSTSPGSRSCWCERSIAVLIVARISAFRSSLGRIMSF